VSLLSGTRLGVYEVTGLLGAGGMGEVYRARDTRLKREVAIKVLPDAFAQDGERLARFQREAELLATLTHPNIATVFGIEDGDGVVAIVMELVEGAPLAGPAPLERALIYASQMCSALEAAHKKGIIHRDLKPANILITKTGVKLLDFGLAKQRSGGTGRSGGTDTDVVTGTDGQVTKMLTGAHVVVGTPQYMAPEQIEGKTVDARTDIFALGCVLYELLTGQKAFDGKTPSSVMAAILATEPRPLTELQPLTPPSLERVVKRCLPKDPDDRWQSVRDIRAELEWIGTGGDRTTSARTVPTTSRVTRLLPWLVAALFAVLASVTTWVLWRTPRAESARLSTSVLPPAATEFDLLSTAPPVLSPDGRWIVFGAHGKNENTRLWLRRLDAQTARLLPGTESAITPFWSPDSRFVGFSSGNALKKIDIAGGAPVTIVENVGSLRGGSWSQNGVILFGLNDGGPIRRVSAAGGAVTTVTTVDPARAINGHRFPWFLPDGVHFLYSFATNDDIGIYVGSLDGTRSPDAAVVHTNSNVQFASGHLLFLRENTLMAQAFNPARLILSGEMTPIEEGIPTVMNPSRVAAFTVSTTGLLAYFRQTLEGGSSSADLSTLTWMDRTGKVLSTVGDRVRLGNIELSPDNLTAVVARRDDARGTDDLYLYDLALGVPTRFTLAPGNDRDPVWSLDGKTLYWRAVRGAVSDLYRKPVRGAGTDELVFADTTNKIPWAILPNQTLLFSSGSSFFALENGSRTPRPLLESAAPEDIIQEAKISADSTWLAFARDEAGRREVFVAPLTEPGAKKQVTSGGANYPRFSHDGKELFFVTGNRELQSVEIAMRGNRLDVLGRPRTLFGGIVNTRGFLYDVTTDGQKFLVAREETPAPLPPLTLVQNWTTLVDK